MRKVTREPAARPVAPGPLLGELLPSWVRYAECLAPADSEADDTEPLFPEEEALIARAGTGRRAEFRSGRRCARLALAQLGHPPGPLPRGRRRMPAWPAGVVGSITHRAGYRAAAVARTADALGVGIDVELHAPLSRQVREAVVLGAERDWLAQQRRRRPEIAWDRLLFSAKESVYKAWSGAGGGWLGFEDAEVTADVSGAPASSIQQAGAASGTFRARLLAAAADGPPLPRQLDGRWLVLGGLLLTAVVVPTNGRCPTIRRSIRA